MALKFTGSLSTLMFLAYACGSATTNKNSAAGSSATSTAVAKCSLALGTEPACSGNTGTQTGTAAITGTMTSSSTGTAAGSGTSTVTGHVDLPQGIKGQTIDPGGCGAPPPLGSAQQCPGPSPLPNQKVRALAVSSCSSPIAANQQPAATTTSDDQGNFALPLPPGTYLVAIVGDQGMTYGGNECVTVTSNAWFNQDVMTWPPS